MKRFALVFGALVLSIQVTGCDSGGSGSPTGEPVARSSDPHLPAEVKEFEAKREKVLADRAAKTAAGKAGKSASK